MANRLVGFVRLDSRTAHVAKQHKSASFRISTHHYAKLSREPLSTQAKTKKRKPKEKAIKMYRLQDKKKKKKRPKGKNAPARNKIKSQKKSGGSQPNPIAAAKGQCYRARERRAVMVNSDRIEALK
ncbi:MAG: hypothetical protein EOM66_05975, partial [Clostridia bacterium]|nr:hypothetical protein [Clostridia bacterium]